MAKVLLERSIRHLTVLSTRHESTPPPIWIEAAIHTEGDTVMADITVYDHDSQNPIFTVEGLEVGAANDSRLSQRSESELAVQAVQGANTFVASWKILDVEVLDSLKALIPTATDEEKRDGVIVTSLLETKDDTAALSLIKSALPQASVSSIEALPAKDKQLLVVPLPQIPEEQDEGSRWARHASSLSGLINILASRATRTSSPRVVFLTDGVLNTPTNSAHSGDHTGYLGLLRTAKSEYPHLDLRLVDVSGDVNAANLAWLLSLSRDDLATHMGHEVALRWDSLYLPRTSVFDPRRDGRISRKSRLWRQAAADDALRELSARSSTLDQATFISVLEHLRPEQDESCDVLIVLHDEIPEYLSGNISRFLGGKRITYASQHARVLTQLSTSNVFRPTVDRLDILPSSDSRALSLFDYTVYDVVVIADGAVQHTSRAAGCLRNGGILISESRDQAVRNCMEKHGLTVLPSPASGTLLSASSASTEVVSAAKPTRPHHEDGCIVITGGNGGLGLLSAKHFLHKRKVVLLSRSGRPAQGCEQLWSELLCPENEGTWVMNAAADVTDAAALGRLRDQLADKSWLPVRGVVHAAGILSDATLASIGPESFEAVYKPKVLGARRLLENLVQQDVGSMEFLVGFSSVATLLGLPAQASYAAANAQLDALLASWRRTKGLPTATVQLGGVADVGMSARVDDHVHAWGVGQIASGDFAGLLQKAIEVASFSADSSGMVLVGANLDFKRLAKTRDTEQNHELSAFLPVQFSLNSFTENKSSRTADRTNHRFSPGSVASRKENRAHEYNLEDLIKDVANVAEEVAGLGDIPRDASLYDSGLDSLSAIQLRNVLVEKFQDVEFAATLVFDHPTIEKISGYIMQQLAAAEPMDRPSANYSPNSPSNDPGIGPANTDRSRGVAIIGVEARMPGGSNSFEEFFANLCAGVDGIRDVPYARWDADDLFDPNPMAGGKACYVQRAGFVDDIEYFDNEAFGITPMEAKVMDPSQRLMLETAYRAFVAAGYDPSRLKDTKTGVFVGSLSPDWRQVLTEHTAYSGTGSALSIIANRISYQFGLLGPSMAVDTACSSSLVAMDLALQQILSGRCDLALVGGVQSILSSFPFINGCKARMLSAKGHCHTWDAAADGYVKAEGCGALVLKDLAAAERYVIFFYHTQRDTMPVAQDSSAVATIMMLDG